MPSHSAFADDRNDLAPGLNDGHSAVRDRRLYSTTARESDPGAADRIEVESEAEAREAMSIERGDKR